jgi:MinD-like ATPase involved in chromosome partitioning or flagellar assembly
MLISVFSPKGGVGKTTLALAFAEVISQKQKVCIIEFDFSPGDFSAILDLDITKNVLLATKYNFNDNVQRPAGAKYDVIVGGFPDAHEQIPKDEFDRMVRRVEEKYDVVLVDIQPGFIERAIDVLNRSDIILLIAEDDYRVAARINGFLDWIMVNNINKAENFFFIVNRKRDKEIKYLDKMQNALPIFYTVPFIKNLESHTDKRLEKHVKAMYDKIVQAYNTHAAEILQPETGGQ